MGGGRQACAELRQAWCSVPVQSKGLVGTWPGLEAKGSPGAAQRRAGNLWSGESQGQRTRRPAQRLGGLRPPRTLNSNAALNRALGPTVPLAASSWF